MKVSVVTRAYDDRRGDLARLQGIINDPNKSKIAKRYADLARKSILHQMEDKVLIALRHRLMKAVIARNERVEWKVTNQIKEYMGEQRLVTPT